MNGVPGRQMVSGVLGVVLFLGMHSAMASGQAPSQPPVAGPTSSAPLTALVDGLVDLFPKLEGEVLEVRDTSLTLDAGVDKGARPGLTLEIFRQGREIRHPKTGRVLGRSEDPLGHATVTAVQDTFAEAGAPAGVTVKAGDRYRVSSGKVRLVLLPLPGGVKEKLVEAATQELVELLGASGRFQVTMGDAISVHLAEQRIKAEDFLVGRGVKEAATRFKADNILAIHFKRVQGKPFMDVGFFTASRPDPALTTAFFVPSGIREAGRTVRFSRGGPASPPQAKARSLLARLLGGDVEAGTYSSAEDTLPLREVAKFAFPVLAMDIAVAPKDKIPRMVVSDGDQVYLYRIVEHKVEPEWTKSVRSLGRVFSLQLADLDADGNLEVVGNRYDPNTELSAFILTAPDGKPQFMVDYVNDFLFAVDLTGSGVKQTLWTQRFTPGKFFTPGQAAQAILKDNKLVEEKQVRVPTAFRPMGAAFSNIMGKDTRVLAFVDEFNRLQIANEGEDLWRSSTSVGGGYMRVEVLGDFTSRMQRSSFVKIEPTPLAVDLDGDGIDELLVPQNLVKEGLLAVIFKGPAGFRLQSVSSGFEGGITCLGAYKTEDATQPTVIASVVRFSNFLKTSGETQIIMTVPQD